jgi:hypothetical protein
MMDEGDEGSTKHHISHISTLHSQLAMRRRECRNVCSLNCYLESWRMNIENGDNQWAIFGIFCGCGSLDYVTLEHAPIRNVTRGLKMPLTLARM